MDRVKCDIRAATQDDRGMLTLLAETTLRPLATAAGHPEKYHVTELLGLLDRADVYVAQTGAETAGFVAVEPQGEDLAVRCLCVHPNFEAQGVAHQLLDWAEGAALGAGRRRITAFVPADDQPSLHLYRGHEFVVLPAEDDTEMVVLEKRLPRAE